MFTDPLSVTISAVAQSLPRTSVGDHTASYTKDDETVALAISHMTSNRGRVRRMVRLDVNKITADPFVANTSRRVSSSCYVVIDEPKDGTFTNAELLANAKGLVGFLSDANLTKVIAGES